jgi:hypothetical protein
LAVGTRGTAPLVSQAGSSASASQTSWISSSPTGVRRMSPVARPWALWSTRRTTVKGPGPNTASQPQARACSGLRQRTCWPGRGSVGMALRITAVVMASSFCAPQQRPGASNPPPTTRPLPAWPCATREIRLAVRSGLVADAPPTESNSEAKRTRKERWGRSPGSGRPRQPSGSTHFFDSQGVATRRPAGGGRQGRSRASPITGRRRRESPPGRPLWRYRTAGCAGVVAGATPVGNNCPAGQG